MKLTSDQLEAIVEAMCIFENTMDRLHIRLEMEQDENEKKLYTFLLKRSKKHWGSLREMLLEAE